MKDIFITIKPKINEMSSFQNVFLIKLTTKQYYNAIDPLELKF